MPTVSWPRSSRLKLVFEHLEAVREIDSFLKGDECESEIKALRRIVERELSRAVFEPANWTVPVWDGDDLFSRPRAKWKVCREDALSVVVGIARPVNADDEYEPYVGLYAPKKWKRLSLFTALLVEELPKGFEHIANHPNEGFLIDYPIWRYIPYGDFVRSGIGFDLPAFLSGLTEAARSMVAMEKCIDRLLGRMR